MNKSDLDIDNLVSFVMEENKIPDISLQKYYQLKWFFNALKNNRFTFQEPSTWDDPFEDFISHLSNPNGSYVHSLDITNGTYAMSTINKRSECNGMWQNFANVSGVLIHTSSRKLIKSLISFLVTSDCFADRKIFMNGYDVKRQLAGSIKLRKIKYMSDKSIADFFKNITSNENVDYNNLQFKSLSIKRNEYDYESEYRLFLIPQHFTLKESAYLNAGYFTDTITKITLSPKASKTRINRLKCILTNKYNIPKDIIEQSKLYDINDFKSKYGLK